mgnify:CR=1 FL=1
MLMTGVPYLSLIVKIGVLSSRGDLLDLRFPTLGSLIRTCGRDSVRGFKVQSSKASDEDEDREPTQSSFDDRHVVEGVVVEFYFAEVAYYVSPCYEVKGFEAIGCR